MAPSAAFNELCSNMAQGTDCPTHFANAGVLDGQSGPNSNYSSLFKWFGTKFFSEKRSCKAGICNVPLFIVMGSFQHGLSLNM